MKHGPRRILATLGASALALGASVALASPALADTVTRGCLDFDSPTEELAGIVSEPEDGVVTVSGGTAESSITVTLSETPVEADGEVTLVTIGDPDAPYTGSIEFKGIAEEGTPSQPHPLSIRVANGVAGGSVTIDGCNLVGTDSQEPAIQVFEESDVELAIGESTIQGAAGAKGQTTFAGSGVNVAGDSTITISGVTTVLGGVGGDASSDSVAPGPGGFGIYAPDATLVMTNGNLNVQAGYWGSGSDLKPAQLPIALTVGAFDLSNGTGQNGQGPSITAVGWPREDAKPLPVSGFDAGDPADGTYYPWVFQASRDMHGEDAFVENYAGSGWTEPIDRAGWQWFNIGPHEISGLEAVPITSTGYRDFECYQQLNPLPDAPTRLRYAFGVVPVFEGLEDVPVYQAILDDSDETIDIVYVEDPAFSPANAMVQDVETGFYYVAPDYTGRSVTVAGTADLPSSFTALNPDVSPSVETAIPVQRCEIIYRLYNQYEGTHLYTKDIAEVENCVRNGWTNENAFWGAPADAAGADYVICRMYNPYNGDHYYIEETNEDGIRFLESQGWRMDSEAASFLSYEEATGQPVYTLFNPYSKIDTHLYTPNEDEVEDLLGRGWELNQTIIYGIPGMTFMPVAG